jgi:hypothetical protein
MALTEAAAAAVPRLASVPGVLFQRQTPEVEQWLVDRRAKGQDTRDEVWEGVYVVMAPAPSFGHGRLVMQLGSSLAPAVAAAGFELADAVNIGEPRDYRIPDLAVVDPATVIGDGVWLRSAVLVAEIRSPGEAHEEKLAFYLAHDVAEVVLIDPAVRTVRWLAAVDGAWRETDTSAVLGVSVSAIADEIRWP